MTDSTIGALIAAASGLLGAALGSIVPFLLNKRTSKLEYELKKIELEKTASYRFGDAVARLQDDNLGVRMGALYELKKLGVSSPSEQKNIVRILSFYMQEGIEKENQTPSRYNQKLRPDEGVFEAGEIASMFFKKAECRVDLSYLMAKEKNLNSMQLQGAWLNKAQLQRASLIKTQLQNADLFEAQLQGADLNRANLTGAINLTAAQLLKAKNVEKAILDPSLRAEYDRLKAEQEKPTE